jgi:hypothetical protein
MINYPLRASAVKACSMVFIYNPELGDYFKTPKTAVIDSMQRNHRKITDYRFRFNPETGRLLFIGSV